MFKVNEEVVLGSRQEEVPRRSCMMIFQDGAIVVKKSLEEEGGRHAVIAAKIPFPGLKTSFIKVYAADQCRWNFSTKWCRNCKCHSHMGIF